MHKVVYLFKAYFPKMVLKATQIIVVKTTFSLVWDIILSLLRSRSTTVLTDPLPNLDFLTLWTGDCSFDVQKFRWRAAAKETEKGQYCASLDTIMRGKYKQKITSCVVL